MVLTCHLGYFDGLAAYVKSTYRYAYDRISESAAGRVNCESFHFPATYFDARSSIATSWPGQRGASFMLTKSFTSPTDRLQQSPILFRRMLIHLRTQPRYLSEDFVDIDKSELSCRKSFIGL